MRYFMMAACMLCCTYLYAQLPGLNIPAKQIRSAIQKNEAVNIKNIATVNQFAPASDNLRPKAVSQTTPALKRTSIQQRSHNQSSSVADEYTCFDTSFTKLIGLTDQWVYFYTALHTSDDGILACGQMTDSTDENPGWQTNGFIIKTDNNGNVAWVKRFADGDTHPYFLMYIFRLFELSNKDIIAIASMDTISGINRYVTVILRLNTNGELLSYTPIESSLIGDFTNDAPIDIRTVTEAPGGDLILAGSTVQSSGGGNYQTVIRMTGDGKIVWDANFGNEDYEGGADGIGAFFVNGNIVLCGTSYGGNYIPVAISFLTLDYATGNLLNKSFSVPDFSNVTEQNKKGIIATTSNCFRLQNGHYVIYGTAFGGHFLLPGPVDQFIVTEFDENFLPVSAYSITTKETGLSANSIYLDAANNLQYCFSRNRIDSTFDIFLVTEKNNQLLKSRKLHFDKVFNSGPVNALLFNDGSYLFAQSYFDVSTENLKSFFEFKKLHNSDTASACLGTDSLLSAHSSFTYRQHPGYIYLDDNLSNKISVFDYLIAETDIGYHTENGCVQKNFCDTVSIHGNTTICSTKDPVLFTVHKNASCGAYAFWNIDTSAITSLQQLNDTTVAIQFKNVNWTGNLYAQLPASKCFTATPADSLLIHLSKTNDRLSLGSDTTLCGTNTSLLLHAGSGFKNYTWQDGSTDSVYKAAVAGKYYVTVTTYCGNRLSDTIIVKKTEETFSIGNDTSKCNGDTVIIKAPTGFIDYSWQNAYNSILVSDSIVKVYPFTDTAYTVSAKKDGCTFFDTVQVAVMHSPVIFLGNDTSICAGTTLRLDAGPGFTKYLWNTGDQTQFINAANAGSYLVKATADNGCFSTDTLVIKAVQPLPVFSLGNDTAICKGETIDYSFNLENTVYVWDDGSTSSWRTITIPGSYWLTVKQQQCNASDSVIILQKPSPTVNLGNDTTLCNTDEKLLNATFAGAGYLWQDGSIASTYTVTKPGLYYVTVSLDECSADDSINISYITPPVFSLGKDTSICNGAAITLQPAMNTPTQYYWQNGSTQPSFTIMQPGNYYLRAINTCGSYTDSLLVTSAICDIVFPSAFTPNHDGLNDIFKIKYPPPVQSYNMIIYNRWGQVVFTSQNITKGWDGTYKGHPVNQDSFVWVVSITDINGRKTNLQGTVTVIR